jgi:16S rRNA (guanine527-N7)-methyltransferase
LTVKEKIAIYKRELLKWNAKVNLIGPEAREHLDAHVAEAVAAAGILTPQGDVLDFGSGGGLPAIPMAIVSPDARFHLVEVDKRKWAFLKHVARECGLNCHVYGDTLARALTRLPVELKFSLVVSRAVGFPETWLPLLPDHLKDGAKVALFQGSPDTAPIAGYTKESVAVLPRGDNNYLLTLAFHVKQAWPRS